MGSKASTFLQDEELQQIQKETGFTTNQIERLYSRFSNLDKSGNGFLTREDFLRIPELAINPLGDRIVEAFFVGRQMDDTLNFRHFINVLACFRPIRAKEVDVENAINSKEKKLEFAFRMYDLDYDDTISRDELLAVLHMMVGDNISEEQLISIVDRAVADADLNKDGLISFEEFKIAMKDSDVERKMSIRFLN